MLGRCLALEAAGAPALTSGDQGTRFDVGVSATGAGLVELRLVQSGRVLASAPSSPAA